MAICDWCTQEMISKVGCTAKQYKIAGKDYDRIPAEDSCHDCAVPEGALHHPGCDMEVCPRCYGQAIGCECPDDDESE